MGKQEENEEGISVNGENVEGTSVTNEENCCCRCNKWCICRYFKLKCLLALILGVSVFVSAVFWLPPFFNYSDQGDLDLDPRYRGHMIVASFKLMTPVSNLEDYAEKLEDDLYQTFPANSNVTILSMKSSGFNTTDIVFAIDPVYKNSISSMQLSLIRSAFEYLVTQRNFQLKPIEVFREPSSFEVLKFPGGITVVPSQTVYPLQKVQISFNFTLYNSILQIQENFEVLQNQLALGLHLTPNENLYIHLTNSRGSTVAPPTTVQTSVVLKVGVPSQPRLKQLAQTIQDSPARNLGLNNTVFGKVKQVSLSSVLQHSLSGNGSPTPAPAPSPLPHRHRHHHYHHQHEYHGALPPASAPSYSPVHTPHPVEAAPVPQISAPSPVKHHAFPSSAPSPAESYQASPPGAHPPVKSYHAAPLGCRFRFRSTYFRKSPEHSHGVETRAPSMPPYHSVGAIPHPQAKPPTGVAHQISPSSPLPNVIYARIPPPSASEMDTEPPDKMPSISPSPSAGSHIRATHCLFSLLISLLLQCW